LKWKNFDGQSYYYSHNFGENNNWYGRIRPLAKKQAIALFWTDFPVQISKMKIGLRIELHIDNSLFCYQEIVLIIDRDNFGREFPFLCDWKRIVSARSIQIKFNIQIFDNHII